MNDRQRVRYERTGRMATFGLVTNGADFPATSLGGQLFAECGGLVQDVDDAKAEQLHGKDTGKEVLVDALHLDLLAIAATSRGISVKEPGFKDKYRMPDSPSESALLTTGDAVVLALSVAGVAQKFIDREMPADFVQHLKDDLKAIRDYKGGKEDTREESVEATAAIARLIKRSSEIKIELDPIVRNKYARTNPDKIAAWRSAAHVERLPRGHGTGGGAAASGGATPPAK
jgi:hypothetical protein